MKRESAQRRSVHMPVLYREVLRELDLAEGLVVVDGTVGAGGHAEKILPRLGEQGRLIGLDRDAWMLELAKTRLQDPRCRLFHSSYLALPEVLASIGLKSVDRILLDLGWSSDQLTDPSRGFAFDSTGPLDLRFDPSKGISAADFLQHASAEELSEVFATYGEEPHARRLAERIVTERKNRPIRTAAELSQLCQQVLPSAGRKNPATRVFQALRIHVNDELAHVEQAIAGPLADCLAVGGRLAVITFHSLEDRLMKHAFRNLAVWQPVTDRPIAPAADEVRFNPRARSAKLRVAVRTNEVAQ